MYRVVLDPGILISAVLSRTGAPAHLLLFWIEGRFEIVVSRKLLTELERVLLRPKFRDHMSEDDAQAYVAVLERRGVLVDDPNESARVSPDPKDDYLVALARAAGARFLISGNVHLKKLELAYVRMLTPRTFLEILQSTGE